MLQMIVKTFLRALLIFLPVAYLSFGKDSPLGRPNGVIYASIGLLVVLIFIIIIGINLWARRTSLSKPDETDHMTEIESIMGHHR